MLRPFKRKKKYMLRAIFAKMFRTIKHFSFPKVTAVERIFTIKKIKRIKYSCLIFEKLSWLIFIFF